MKIALKEAWLIVVYISYGGQNKDNKPIKNGLKALFLVELGHGGSVAKKLSKAAVTKKGAQDRANRKKFLARLPKSEMDWLSLLLFFTKRAISGPKDSTLIEQAERLTKRIGLLGSKTA